MTDEVDNVFYLSDYRHQIHDSSESSDTDLRFTFTGTAADAVREEAQRVGIDVGFAVSSYVELGIEDSKLTREGWKAQYTRNPANGQVDLGDF